jgi:hypothetical protein
VKTCTSEQYRQYLETFAQPAPADRQLIQEGKVGLVFLPENHFRYSKNVGYSFETAALVEEGTDNRLLFLRIDSWDPQYRANAPIDYCIPMAYEGASDRERLTWTIPFGGAWSDTTQEALLVFDATWREWFSCISEGVAFSNRGAESAGFLKFRGR